VAGDDDEGEGSDTLLFGEGIDEPLENVDGAQGWTVMFLSAWMILLKLFNPAMAPEFVFEANEND
jgi:hypothetical protein